MKPSRRVALFTGAYTHIADGVSLTLNRLVAYLLDEGHDVRVFAPTVKNPFLPGNGTLVPVPSVAAPGRRDYRLSLGLSQGVRRALEAFAPDVVHIATPDLLGYSALRWARRWHLPVVATFHTHFASYLPYYGLQPAEPLLWRYLRSFYNACDLVLVPSAGMSQLLSRKGVCSSVAVWSRGVDHTRFSPAHRSAGYRQTIGGAEVPIVLYVGRLVKEKGLATFADVILRLQHQGVPHSSLIVGEGPLRRLLQDRLPGTVFAGHLTGHALAQAYASADVFFFPSQSETFGNVVLEAAASGLPVIAAESAAFKALIEHGQSGFTAPAEDAEKLAGYVGTLLHDPQRREQMGKASLEISMKFDWDGVLAQMPAHYQSVYPLRAATFHFSEAPL